MPGLLVGLDGARSGWVAAIEQGSQRHLHLIRELDELPSYETAAIDIPLGFPTSDGRRPAELHARRVLGPRRSSVFPTPPRAVLECPDYDEARRVAVATTGRSVTKQAWNLQKKVLEAATWSGRLHEAHPELAFARMTGAPMPDAKSSRQGSADRLGALAAVGLAVESFVGRNDVPLVDAIDAIACLWVARRLRAGTAESLGCDFGPDDGPIHV